MKPLAILGIDPGTTAAYALIDLQGNLIQTYSSKEFSSSDLIKKVIELSKPVLIATDKAKVPSFVQDIAAKLGCIIWHPKQDLAKEEKYKLVRIKTSNDHEADALAAALFCFKEYKVFIAKINEYVKGHNLKEHHVQFTQLALRKDLSFTHIKDILTKPKEESVVMKEVLIDQKVTDKNFTKLYERFKEKEKDVSTLNTKLRELHQKIKELKKENALLKSKSTNIDSRVDKATKYKQDKINHLEKKVKDQKKYSNSLSKTIQKLYAFIPQVTTHLLCSHVANLSFSHSLTTQYIFVDSPAIYSQKTIARLENAILFSTSSFPDVIKKKCSSITVTKEDIVATTKRFVLLRSKVLEKNRIEIERMVQEYKERITT